MGHDREHRLLGQGAVPDLPPLGTSHEARFADGERRHVVVVHVPLRVLGREGVEHLFHLEHPESGDVQHLGLATLEQSRSVGPAHQPGLDQQRTDVGGSAPVEPDALIGHHGSHHVLENALERSLEGFLVLVGDAEFFAHTAWAAAASAAFRSALPAIRMTSSSLGRAAAVTRSYISGV